MSEGGRKPDVSVIIPMFNEAGYIGLCLESLREQTYLLERMEIIVVDGASRDRSAEIVESMASEFPNLRLLRNSVRWTPELLNMAIGAATAETIIRLDCHCRYSPDYIKTCVEVLRETAAGCVGGRLVAKSGVTGLVAESIRQAQESRFGTGGSRWRSGGRAGYIDTVPFGCFPRTIFDEVGLYDVRLPRNQDIELASRIRAFGHKIYFDPRIEATYYTRTTFGSYFRMLWLNGLYHCLTWRVNPNSLRLRHFIPMVFLMGIVVGLVSLLVLRPLAYAAGAGLALYLLLDLAFSVRIARSGGWRLLLIMPWLFLLTHLFYGLSTIAGLLRFGFVPVPENPDVKRPAGGEVASE